MTGKRPCCSALESAGGYSLPVLRADRLAAGVPGSASGIGGALARRHAGTHYVHFRIAISIELGLLAGGHDLRRGEGPSHRRLQRFTS